MRRSGTSVNQGHVLQGTCHRENEAAHISAVVIAYCEPLTSDADMYWLTVSIQLRFDKRKTETVHIASLETSMAAVWSPSAPSRHPKRR